MLRAPDPCFKKAEFENDTRNVSDLWSQAIQSYNETAEVALVTGRFSDTQAMINFGTKEMNQFHKWRHDDKKVDKLRKLFIGNIDFVEAGVKQVTSAASTAFPPATAIATAMTMVLSAAKSVSADYDVIINFFEDMNNFLQRVSIVATRVPRKQAYQNALLDVFSTFLYMIGLAHKTISLGRFKKWAINAVFGGDSDLSGSRQKMDVSLARLQSATEFAILDNSENMLDKQQDLEALLAEYQQELIQNQRIQQRLASSQILALQKFSDTLQECKDDIKKLLEFTQKQRENNGRTTAEQRQEAKKDSETAKKSANRIRSFMSSYDIPDIYLLTRELEKNQVEGMGAWIFEKPLWLKWINEESNGPRLITVGGPPGVGKSFISLAIYRHLQQLSQLDPDRRSCAAYFTCHGNRGPHSIMLQALISMTVQLVDQYPMVLQFLEAKMEDEASLYSIAHGDAAVWWNFFVFDVFGPESEYQLYLVFDAINELSSDEQRQEFRDLIARIDQRHLKIKVITTDRLQAQDEAVDRSETIHMDKELILSDLKKLIWDRLHNSDSAYEGLRRLRKPTKQKLARKVEEHADGILYAEQMLRYLSGIARESAIKELLSKALPSDLIGLYEMILNRVTRRLDAVSLSIMRTIVVWASFALRWLSLAELNALGTLLFPEEAGIVEEKLLDDFTPFFEMSYSLTDMSEIDASVDPTILFSDQSLPFTEADQIDSKIYVKLRERTMKTFFGADVNSEHNFTTSSSRANALIFLTSTRMVLVSEPGAKLDSGTKSIFDYAVANCLKHWVQIDPVDHADEEKVEICSAFVEVITSRKFAKAVIQLPNNFGILDLLGTAGAGQNPSVEQFYEKWKIWSDIARRLPLNQEISTYWSEEHENAVWPLAKSYIANWLNSADSEGALKACLLAMDAIENTRKKGLLDKILDDEDTATNSRVAHGDFNGVDELMSVVRICEIGLDRSVHYPYAVVLAEMGRHSAAITVYKEALIYCSDKHQTAHCQTNLGLSYRELEDLDQAIHWFDEALRTATDYLDLSLEGIESLDNTTQNITNGTGIFVRNDLEPQQQLMAAEIDDMRTLLSNVLVYTSTIKYCLEQYDEAATLMRWSRRCCPDIVPALNLFAELECLWKAGPRYADIMNTLMEFKAIERLNLMTSPSLTFEEQLKRDKHLRLASARSQRKDDLFKVYEDAITVLDAEEAGAPMRVSFAREKRLLEHDNKGAKALLDQVLDSVSEQSYYKVTESGCDIVAARAIGCLSSILLEEFCQTKTGAEKHHLSLDVKGLSQRSLPSTISILSSNWNDSHLVLARMLQKLGPASEYERVMNNSFNFIMASLTDAISENDFININALARILSLIPGLQRFNGDDDMPAMRDDDEESALSADWDETQSGTHTSSCKQDGENYDINTDEHTTVWCDGICSTETAFTNWNELNPYYSCLVCTYDSALCKGCYEIRMQWNRDPCSKPETEPNFCCSNGLYITGPVKGWRGIKNGIIYLDSDATKTTNSDESVKSSNNAVKQIPFRDLLKEIEVAWKNAWEDYWAGM